MYVYLLKSIKYPQEKYIGITLNIKRRLDEHNRGKSYHTAKYLPWELVAVTWFKDNYKARKFEKYLKIGSGHAFANRHFW